MDVIVTHQNADYDALASLVAAKKLYPQARVVLPSMLERNVREFIIMIKGLIVFDAEADIPFAAMRRLIVVDTRSPARIGLAGAHIGREDLAVHCFDHHPRRAGDLRATKDLYRAYGATVSIFVELFKRRRMAISPLEATIFALGIYEDTGSLTFPTTTKKDIDLAAFLYARGANLSLISTCLSRELDEAELKTLAALLAASQVYTFGSLHIAITIAADTLAGMDLSLLAMKLQDVENCAALFLIVPAGKRVHVVARSRLARIDVAAILQQFGGNGHASAAAASIPDLSIAAVEEQLRARLYAEFRTRATAADIMSAPVKTVSADALIKHTAPVLETHQFSAMPIVAADTIIGFITLADMQRAVRAGYGHAPVKGYMRRGVCTAAADTPVDDIIMLMQKKNAAHVLVMRDSALIGIISRADVLKVTHGDMMSPALAAKPQESIGQEAPRDVRPLLEKIFPAPIQDLLAAVAAGAAEMRLPVYLIGGCVRDLLRGVVNEDLDFVVEGPAPELGVRLAARLAATVTVFSRFKTAKLQLPGGQTVDLATARTEYYEYPAALPVVQSASLRQDLSRRDFTINTLAVSVAGDTYGRLYDFFGGIADLERRRIRVLHDLSFVEDPTRILRAVRFEQRLDFHIDSHTEDLLRAAVDLEMFSRLQTFRLGDELRLLLSEPHPPQVIRRMWQLHELHFIHPAIRYGKHLEELLSAVRDVVAWYSLSFLSAPLESWILYLLALLDDVPTQQAAELFRHFGFRKKHRTILRRATEQTQELLAWAATDLASEAPPDRNVPREVRMFAAAKAGDKTQKEKILRYSKMCDTIVSGTNSE